MFANLLSPQYDDQPTAQQAVPPIDQARSEEDFKRIELKLTQMGLFLSMLTVAMTIYGLQKGR